jgi:MFS superfamily sulfate permease-like transporter
LPCRTCGLEPTDASRSTLTTTPVSSSASRAAPTAGSSPGSRIPVTGAAVLRDTITRLESHGITVLLSGVRDRSNGVLDALGVYSSLAHEGHLFTSTPAAIAHARRHVAREPHQATETVE